METQTILVGPDQYSTSGKKARFFIFTGTLEPPLVSIQDVSGDNGDLVECIYAQPVIHDNRRGVCVTVRFRDEEVAAGHTFHLSLYQKGLSTHPEVMALT